MNSGTFGYLLGKAAVSTSEAPGELAIGWPEHKDERQVDHERQGLRLRVRAGLFSDACAEEDRRHREEADEPCGCEG